MQYHVVEVTPTLDTNAYATGDRMGSIMSLAGMNADAGTEGAMLEKIVVLDKAKQSIAFDILFFDESPTVASADNAAVDITDAEMEKCIGFINVATGDYKALANSSVACQDDLRHLMKPESSGTCYALCVARGTATYAASDLVFKFYFRW